MLSVITERQYGEGVAQGLSEHSLQLATELLEDIELSQAPISTVVFKAARLARLVHDDEVQRWLGMELRGYSNDGFGRQYMARTGRWINPDEDSGYWQSVVDIDTQITSHETLLAASMPSHLSGEGIIGALVQARTYQSRIVKSIADLARVRSKVLALLHHFVTTRYYELAFSQQQAGLFESARLQVDALLSPLSGDTLAKVDSIYRRLGENDDEATSQALATCRRLIDTVANAIYPPRGAPVMVAGQEVHLGPPHIKNRLNAYIRDNTASDSRRDKLRRRLADLYERVSAGVHSDVSSDEARFIFLNTYLFLGEVLSLHAGSALRSGGQQTEK